MVHAEGFDVNEEGMSTGDTPLTVAARFGNLEILETVLSAPNIHPHSFSQPLNIAISADNAAVVLALVERRKNSDGVLHLAASLGAIETMRACMQQLPITASEINKKISHGTPLQLACQSQQVDAVRELLSHPDVDALCLSPAVSHGNTLLHQQCQFGGSGPVIEELVKALGSQVNLRNSSGETPLHLACRDRRVDNVRALLTAPNNTLDVNARHAVSGETGLHIACRMHTLELLQILLDAPGIDVNQTDHNGWTPLHFACRGPGMDLVQRLLASPNINVNARNRRPGGAQLRGYIASIFLA